MILQQQLPHDTTPKLSPMMLHQRLPLRMLKTPFRGLRLMKFRLSSITAGLDPASTQEDSRKSITNALGTACLANLL